MAWGGGGGEGAPRAVPLPRRARANPADDEEGGGAEAHLVDLLARRVRELAAQRRRRLPIHGLVVFALRKRAVLLRLRRLAAAAAAAAAAFPLLALLALLREHRVAAHIARVAQLVLVALLRRA
eukprot:5001326-Prymnesium_polylepis.1